MLSATPLHAMDTDNSMDSSTRSSSISRALSSLWSSNSESEQDNGTKFGLVRCVINLVSFGDDNDCAYLRRFIVYIFHCCRVKKNELLAFFSV